MTCVLTESWPASSTRLGSTRGRRLGRVADRQRLRWATGKKLAAQASVEPLLRRRNLACFEATWHLLAPPVAIAVFSLALGASALALGHAWAAALVAAGLLVLLGGVVALALVEAGTPTATWMAPSAAPANVAWKAWIQARAFANLARRKRRFAATPRE